MLLLLLIILPSSPQAVEKALKALLYHRDADLDCLQSHNLSHLAAKVSDASLLQLAHQMESQLGPHTRMRYPDVLCYPSVPADVYRDEHVILVCQVAGSALDRVRDLIQVIIYIYVGERGGE